LINTKISYKIVKNLN